MTYKKIVSMTPVLAAFTLASFVPTANAGEPAQRIFQQCSKQLEDIVDKAGAHQAAQATDSVRRIRRLMKQGFFKQAALEATISVEELLETTETYQQQVTDLRDSCLNQLRRHGAFKLYQKFAWAADDAQTQINQNLQDSVAKINALMHGVR